MTSESRSRAKPQKLLSLVDAISVMVGIIIGAGIFQTAPLVAGNCGGPGWLIFAWALGGIVALVGAWCFVQLAAEHPDKVGGDYVYLKSAYGVRVAFLFAWAAFWIVRPANIGNMALVFGTYLKTVVPEVNVVYVASVAVVVLSLFNLLGLKMGRNIQNGLTLTKVLGIGFVIAIGFLCFQQGGSAPTESLTNQGAGHGSFWLAMVFVMYAYGGWNDIALVAGEVENPRRNMARSLIGGTALVMGIYVAFNLALLGGLGFGGLSKSSAAASDLMIQYANTSSSLGYLWQHGKTLIALLICVSCLGAINGMLLTSPRIYYAVGCDTPWLGFLKVWGSQRSVPLSAVVLQTIVVGLLLLMCLKFDDAFEVLVTVTAPYFWGFLAVTVMSLVLHRIRAIGSGQSGGRFQIFRSSFLPVSFAVVCGALLVNSCLYVFSCGYHFPAAIVGFLMAAGLIAAVLLKFQPE